MAETANTDSNLESNEFFQDHLVVRHPDGKSEKIPISVDEGSLLRIGRELDNDVVLTDLRASRYHAEIRRGPDKLEIMDLDSANGTRVGTTRIDPNIWVELTEDQTAQLGETRITWEKSASAQSTVAMPKIQQPAPAPVAAAPPPVAPTPTAEKPSTSMMPWAVGLVVVLLLLIVGGAIFLFFSGGSEGETAGQADVTSVAAESPAAESTPQSGLDSQTSGTVPTETPTPTGPQLAIPVVDVDSSQVVPIFLGALPSTDKALYRVDVRVQNVGNAPFNLSTSDFTIRTPDGETLPEAGGTTTEEGLRRLGIIDRFDDLNLTPGGSVPESLIFEVLPQAYNFELVFQPPEVNPIVLGLGTVRVNRELAAILGTALPEETPAAVAAETPTPTLEPTPTATRPPLIPAPQVVPRSALIGTIAYPVFNGTSYDIYFGQVETGETQFFRGEASQPDFSPDGSRIAFHSWSGNSRGLVTMDVSGANETIVANFVEDQLPTWTGDGTDIIFLTRRTGGRQSQLMRVDSTTDFRADEGVVIGEGEYPSIGADGQLVFKGWGTTAFGLRAASPSLENIQTVTNVDEDTAPALSPDGQKIAFMSQREGSWDIYVVNVDGSDLQRLTTDDADDGLPTWSPDGNVIAWVSNRGGPWAIWAMTPEGDGKRQLFTMGGSPDGNVGPDSYASRGWAEERISWTEATFGEE